LCIHGGTADVVDLQLDPQRDRRCFAHGGISDLRERRSCDAAARQHARQRKGLTKEVDSMNRTLTHAFWLAALMVTATPAGAADEAEVVRGRYLATAGDCIACHTAPGGQSMAGGLPLASPLGPIYSTNITPSKTHGIGNYTLEQF